MDRLSQDLRFAVRTLLRSWPVTLLVVGSLALAISGNTIVFALVNGFLYRPLPYEEPHRIMVVGERNASVPEGFVSPTSIDNFLDWRERQTRFSEMSVLRGRALSLDAGTDALERVGGTFVTPGFFDLLGVEPALGRTFLEEEGTRGRHRVVVLSWDWWQEELGGADVLEDTLRLDGETYEIVGVLPEEFDFLFPADLWVPLVVERGTTPRSQRDALVLARLRDGVSEAEAQEEMEAIAALLRDEYPTENRGFVVDVLNLREEIPDPRNRLFFKMLQGAMVFVVLIACANIANLLMARSQRREQEMAVRASLGAGRAAIVRQLITESLLMAMVAGALGAGLGALGVRQMVGALGDMWPAIFAPVIDARVLALTLGVTIFGGLLFGLAPVVQTLRLDLVSRLKDGTRGSSGGRRRSWASSALVVGELALALVFLAGASLLLRGFEAIQSQDAGFETSNLLTFTLDLPEIRYGDEEARVAAVTTLIESLGALPGVERALASNSLPRSLMLPEDGALVEGAAPLAPDQAPPRISWLSTTPGSFDTLGIHTVEGRVLDRTDQLDSRPVVVLNRAAVETLFGDQEALGRRVVFLGEPREVVGVVQDVRHTLVLGGEIGPTAYLPWSQVPLPAVAFSLRTRVEPETLTEPMRRTVRAFDAGLAVSEIRTLDAVVDDFWAGQRIIGSILRGFGVLALLLAAVGTYGVLAYSVVQRTREIGVRMALGADRAAVVALVMRRGLALGAIGLILGIPGVLAVKTGLDQVFAGFVEVEPRAIGGAVAVMVAVIVAASFLPARRAASLDPLRALRWE